MSAYKLESLLPDILEIARFAPSVHNTQPWKTSVVGEELKIQVDEQYTLKDGDPTGRQSIICLGIFTESIYLAAQDRGLTVKDISYKEGVATLRFIDSYSKLQATYSSLIRQRCSDRSVYQPISLDNETLQALTHTYSAPDTTICVATGREIIRQVAALTKRAMNTALSSPDFRQELSNYLVLPWSSKNRGISVRSLRIPYVAAILQPFMLKFGIGIRGEGDQEEKRWLSASADIFITAKGDMPYFWFNAGRTYLRTCLAVEELGFSQATSAAIVEASNYHEDIEALLHTSERILAVIRIGKGSTTKHYSPRVNIKEIVTSN